jgi:hypothetical protein
MSPDNDGGTKMLIRVIRNSQYAGTIAEYSVSIVMIPGQITCDKVVYKSDMCIISYKIDDGPVQMMGGSIDVSSSEYSVFDATASANPKAFSYLGATEFIEQIRNAKTLTMEASSFQAGTYQFQFTPAGFPIGAASAQR